MSKTRSRVWATIEVCLCFALLAWLFDFIRGTPFVAWESDIVPASRLLFVEYGIILVGVLILLFTKRDLAKYGLSLKNYREHFYVIAIGVLPMSMLGCVLSMLDWETWPGALSVAAFELILLIIIGWLLRQTTVSGNVIGMTGLLLIPWVWEGFGDWRLRWILLKTAYQYMFVGPAEELLFRGYIQTRLNEAYGKPYTFFGVQWGWGIVVASLLFGLWHVVPNLSLPHRWLHGLWTIGLGLVLGYFRERSDSILASSMLHSVVNYVPLFDLFR